MTPREAELEAQVAILRAALTDWQQWWVDTQHPDVRGPIWQQGRTALASTPATRAAAILSAYTEWRAAHADYRARYHGPGGEELPDAREDPERMARLERCINADTSLFLAEESSSEGP